MVHIFVTFSRFTPLVFGRSVKSIPTKGADFAHPINTGCPKFLDDAVSPTILFYLICSINQLFEQFTFDMPFSTQLR
jgi:hypothetical protein